MLFSFPCRTSGGSTQERVVVLGATNRPQDLDEAVLRRFSRRIFCDMPNKKAREAILKVKLYFAWCIKLCFVPVHLPGSRHFIIKIEQKSTLSY